MRKGLMMLAVLCPLMVVGCGPQLEDETTPTTEESAAGATGTVTQLKYVCGDGICNTGEATTCPEDCGGGGGWCGDGFCNGTESYSTCSLDCPYTPPSTWCGDGVCQSWNGESTYNCSIDCGGGGGTCRTSNNGRIPCEL
jgi:hypothetical protein